MDGIILLVILVPVVFLFLLIAIYSRSGEQQSMLRSLMNQITILGDEIAKLKKEREKVGEKAEPKVEEKQVWKKPPPVIHESKFEEKPEPIQPTPIIPPPKPPEKKIVPEEPTVLVEKKMEKLFPAREKRDMEKFIGENLANKIGVAVLVLGIAFFVKYAIDKNWIREAGRVLIGLVSGAILIGLAHYFRNRYRSFSSVLVGGGLTVFYISVGFAFHQYHLVGQTGAFISMVIISAFAVVLSLFYNRQELAILATIGGFATPFLVSTGKENMVALFTYIAILNAGWIGLSWFKRWPAINSIALFFTTLIFGAWLIRYEQSDLQELFRFKQAFLFASLFYVQFVIMNLLNILKLKEKFTGFDFIIYLSFNFLYYLAAWTLGQHFPGEGFAGIFTLLLGVFNLILAAVFYRNQRVDRNVFLLLLGLGVTFFSLTALVEFEANHIVLFWAAEAVILLALYNRSKIRVLSIASVIILVLMLIGLLYNNFLVYFLESASLPVFFNKGFSTSLAASAALFIYYYLCRKRDPQQESFLPGTNWIRVLAILALYFTGLLEIVHQFSTRYNLATLDVYYSQLYTFAFVVILLQVFRKNKIYPRLKVWLTATCFLFYLMFLDYRDPSVYSLVGVNKTHFLAHGLAVLILLGLLIHLAWFVFREREGKKLLNQGWSWPAAIAIILLLSLEFAQLILWMHYRDEEDLAWWNNMYNKAGLTILWSILSFTWMWLGMKYGIRILRVISLSLFSITLVKLFVYDIRDIPPGGKIAAFILLGVLLLVVSFMYQRLKRIIMEDTG